VCVCVCKPALITGCSLGGSRSIILRTDASCEIMS